LKLSYLKKLPIITQLSLLLSLIVLVMMLVLTSNYVRSVEVVKKDNSDYLKGIISQLNQSIASNSDDLKKIIETVTYNGQTVQKFLTVSDPVGQFNIYSQLKAYLSDMMGVKAGILDIALIGNNGSYFNLRADTKQLASISREIPEKVMNYYIGLREVTIVNTPLPVLVAGAPIYSTTDFSKADNKLGTVLVLFDVRALLGNGVSEQLFNGATVYMSDRAGNVFFTNDETVRLGDPIPNENFTTQSDRYLFHREAIADFDGEIIIAMPKQALLKGLNDIRRQQLIIVGVALLLLILPLLFVVNNILQPLKKLMRLMSEVRLGQKEHLRKRIQVEGYAEMIIMAGRFNDMMAEIDELTDHLVESKKKLYETELIKRRAELSYLQSQINPHFLYNTLESIKGLAADEGSTQIFELTKSLALFFRFSIKGPDMVSLERELNIVKNYVYIHQIRFGDRLQVEYDIEEGCLDCTIPKMILQPIVENAINHGIEPMQQHSGLLVIRGHTEGSELYLSVEDNGQGMLSERLEEITRALEAQAADREQERSADSGIGLLNVHDRVRIKFGAEYGIRISSKQGDGTTVSLRLPVRSEL
jgi:two-component system sensor histidine kinase YesM